MNDLDLESIDHSVRTYLGNFRLLQVGKDRRNDLLYYIQQTAGILDKYQKIYAQESCPREELHILRLKYIRKLKMLLNFNDPPLRELASKVSKIFYQLDYSKCQYCGGTSTTIFNETCYICEICFAEQYVDRRSPSKTQNRSGR